MRRPPTRWLFDSLLAGVLVSVGLAAPRLCAQGSTGPPAKAKAPAAETTDELLRLTRNVAGDSKQILLDADQVSTWRESNVTVLLFRGRVLLQQSVVQVRCDECVAWIDMDRYRRTGIWRMEVYAEGHVRVENSSEVKEGGRLLLELNTRGEIKISAHSDKVKPEVKLEEGVYKRGRLERAGPVKPVAATAPAGSQPQVVPAALRPEVSPPSPPPLQSTPPLPIPGGPPTSPPQPIEPRRSYAEPIPGFPMNDTAPAPPAGVLPSTPPLQVSVPPPAPTAVQVDAPPGTPPPTPLPPPSTFSPRPPGAPAPGPPKVYSIQPRYGTPTNYKVEPLGNGEQAIIVTGGVILTVRNIPNIGLLDIEADQVVVWTKAQNGQQVATQLNSPEGETGRDFEFYLKGNVEIRRSSRRENQTLRADECYYDVTRNTALALTASLELKENPVPGKSFVLSDSIFVRAEELRQLSETQYKVFRSDIFSSKLPSDPGLKIVVSDADIEERRVQQTSIFGRPVVDRITGQPVAETQSYIESRNVYFDLEDVPFFYLPYLSGRADDPLGPLQDFSFGYNNIYGVTVGATFDVYKLLGLQAPPDTTWRVNTDYFGARGPGLGTEFDYTRKEIFGVPARLEGFVKGYILYDDGYDVLGGSRPINDYHPPDERGRLLWRQNIQDLPQGFTVQSQLSVLSDRNFLEEYIPREFSNDYNQETYVYLKQQEGNWAWTATLEPRLRRWVTETQRLPEFEGHLIGYTLFDKLTTTTRVSGGYFRLDTSTDREPAVSPTDQTDATARFDVMETVSLPFYLGPVKTVPYLKGDFAEYSRDLDGTSLGRAWGGFGVEESIPLTRIYPDVKSELFNLEGIAHKIVLSTNYFYAESNEPYTKLPQLDRLNDDATDQALRDIRPLLPSLNPANGTVLATSKLYDPQLYAIRQLIDNRIDTLDSIEVLQVDINQRLQTKRGYPGSEHIVDWMTLDLSASYFPNSTRDNFGERFAFLQYDYLWNVGDRTAIASTGWIDPVTDGARVFTIGGYFNRTDRTNFYLGYREIEPVGSRAVTGAVTYVFSPKYSLTASSTYDFGTQQSLSNNLVLTRIGSDLTVSLGISYNALTSSVGGIVEIVPNLVPANRGYGGVNPGSILR